MERLKRRRQVMPGKAADIWAELLLRAFREGRRHAFKLEPVCSSQYATECRHSKIDIGSTLSPNTAPVLLSLLIFVRCRCHADNCKVVTEIECLYTVQ